MSGKYTASAENKDGISPKPAQVTVKKDIRIIIFGGVDLLGTGDTGNAVNIGNYVAKLAQSKNIQLSDGDIQVYNSPYIFITTNQSYNTTSDVVENDIYKVVYEKNFMNRTFNKKNGICIIYGYSFGGQYAIGLSKYLEKKGITINALYTVDGAKGPGSAAKHIGIYAPKNFKVDTTIPSNVEFNLNIYQTKPSMIGSRGFPNSGSSTVIKNIELTNVKNVRGELIVHSNIDEYSSGMITQSIIYFLQGNKSILGMNVDSIKQAIKTFDNELYY